MLNESFEKFMSGLRQAFEASRELEGVSRVHFHIDYYGHDGSEQYVADAVNQLSAELGMSC